LEGAGGRYDPTGVGYIELSTCVPIDTSFFLAGMSGRLFGKYKDPTEAEGANIDQKERGGNRRQLKIAIV
jgi:hypothetical protein